MYGSMNIKSFAVIWKLLRTWFIIIASKLCNMCNCEDGVRTEVWLVTDLNTLLLSYTLIIVSLFLV